jgi:hypothetical protein
MEIFSMMLYLLYQLTLTPALSLREREKVLSPVGERARERGFQFLHRN